MMNKKTIGTVLAIGLFLVSGVDAVEGYLTQDHLVEIFGIFGLILSVGIGFVQRQ